MHSLIIPDVEIEFLKSVSVLAIIEEAFVAELLLVFLIDINGQDDRTSGDGRRLVVQESGVIKLEFTDLEGHILDGFVGVII